MNEKLQFSWGHIIAFLALIVVSYTSFVGTTYLIDGNFQTALVAMFAIDVFFILFFIGAQQMKASGVNIKRKIIWERLFVFGSPIVLVAGMVAMSHFFTVQSREARIVDSFTTSIANAQRLFVDYEEYAQSRIDAYENTLETIIEKKKKYPNIFQEAGFKDGKENIQKDNMVRTLELQLLSDNYTRLKNAGEKWIYEANKGASTWNVFLLGNTKEIKEFLINWESQLGSFASDSLSNENILAEVEKFDSYGARDAIAGINSLTSAFTKTAFPNVYAILFAVVVYFMLLFPYILQERHSKSIYRLVGDEKTNAQKRSGNKPHQSALKTSSAEKQNNFQSPKREKKLSNQPSAEDDDDYPSF